MSDRLRGSRRLVLGVVLGAGLVVTPAIADAKPVHLSVSFEADARLGQPTAMRVTLAASRALPPVVEFRLLTASGIELGASRLGVVSCERSDREAVQVMNPIEHRPCPQNSLLGTGSATAGLILDPAETLYGTAVLELYSGAPVDERPGLVVIADTYNPIRVQLTYRGYVYVPPAGFGSGLAIQVRPIPEPPFGAPIALSRFDLTVGSSTLTYTRKFHGQRRRYHPGGIPLPTSCPAGGFHFRAILRFADGSRRVDDAHAACPSRRQP